MEPFVQDRCSGSFPPTWWMLFFVPIRADRRLQPLPARGYLIGTLGTAAFVSPKLALKLGKRKVSPGFADTSGSLNRMLLIVTHATICSADR